jgi:hypothetical protein
MVLKSINCKKESFKHLFKRIGVEGFEPPTYCSQSSRASQAALYSVDLREYTQKRINEKEKERGEG